MDEMLNKILECMGPVHGAGKALADHLGISPNVVTNWKNGSNKSYRKYASQIAQFYGVSVEYLRGKTTQKSSIPAGFEPLPKMVRRPLIGDIACGEPITAEQNVRDYVDVPEDVACDFCLRCHGDSMIDAGIRDNDVVYIRIQPEVNDGEIAAVRIGDEATLKRVYYDGSTITLVPANSAYRPKSYAGQELENIQIEGKAVGFTHWF